MEPTLIRRRPPPGVDECWVLDHYAARGGRTELADLFTSAKYRHPAGAAQLAKRLADAVRLCAPDASLLKRADKVIALPSRRGLTWRLGSELAEELGLDPLDTQSLYWNRPVQSMKNIPLAERAKYVEGAMTASPLAGATVVLVDDVMQTLATVSEASRAVRAAGADRVACIALVIIDSKP